MASSSTIETPTSQPHDIDAPRTQVLPPKFLAQGSLFARVPRAPGAVRARMPGTYETPSDGPTSRSAVPPLLPADRVGTSLRIILQDTQACMERFSVRIGQVAGGVEQNLAEARMAVKVMESNHDKVVADTADLGKCVFVHAFSAYSWSRRNCRPCRTRDPT